MPGLVILLSASDEDSIKMKSLSSGQHFPHCMSMRDYRASNHYVNGPISTKIELVQDFMASGVFSNCASETTT